MEVNDFEILFVDITFARMSKTSGARVEYLSMIICIRLNPSLGACVHI